jgi:GalNAc-alpha-(1->4)-GalNAc-alpha-(1->3)-diNAcBac-PP-undecaprenol alpha-1,4-N-acetyl-D-galactosaminyltransferase
MRVMFVARAVDRVAGGVERMVITVMNALTDRGHEVDLLTWDLPDARSFYPMTAKITWHRLGLGDPQVRASSFLRLRRAQAVRGIVAQRRPQVIVCFQDGPFMAVRAYTLGLKIPTVVSERNAPSRFDHIAAGRYRHLIYQTFRLAIGVVVQCESHRALYPSFLHKRIVCIPNPVLPTALQARPDIPGPDCRYRLLSVGRLGFQKNYSILIEAFGRLASQFPNWDLSIIGEGKDRKDLEALIRSHSLEDRVVLHGTTKSIAQWYASSHLFCLPSRWEGFPNALAEALAHGLPAIGFAGCAGVNDLIVNGHNGLLAEGNDNIEGLTHTLEMLLGRGTLRRAMGSQGPDTVRQFDPTGIFVRWEGFLSSVVES